MEKYAGKSGVSAEKLNFYEKTNSLPTGRDLDSLCRQSDLSPVELMLKTGSLDRKIVAAIQKNAGKVYEAIKNDIEYPNGNSAKPPVAFETTYGRLFQGDCLDLMPNMDDESVDLIFADPPFNLNKLYPSKIDDNLKEERYLEWCEKWAGECIRILKPGGSLFIWNLPKWNTHMSAYLNDRLCFRHWIAVDIKYSLPIQGRLYPSHYSLLYYVKGEKPVTFHPDRLPMEICPHCMGDLRDYGGYKNKMNPKGVNLTDVWFDIPPVRHAKYKRRKDANELSIKLLDRIIEMASDEGDLVFDPFGGAGTTYSVAEIKKRKWMGIELGPVEEILRRFENIDEEAVYLAKIRGECNCLFTRESIRKREKLGLWTPDSIRKAKASGPGMMQLSLHEPSSRTGTGR